MNAFAAMLKLADITADELKTLLLAYIPRRFPVLITGAPGVGKSDIVALIAAMLGFDLVISHPVTEDPTDPKGLPFPSADGQSARFLPFGNLQKILSATRPTLWFLDDLGQGSAAVQAAYMQLLLARRVGEHVLPDCVTFIAATNDRSHNAAVSGILDPVISRFATVVNLVPDIKSWSRWAVENNTPHELIAFLRFRQDLLYVPKKGRDIANFPTPRSWGFLGRKMPVIPKGQELREYAGSVGEAAALEFEGFLDVYKEIATLEDILLNPLGARLPDADKPATVTAMVSMLAGRVTAANFDQIMLYVNRMIAADMREFVGFFIQDATTRDPSLQQTHTFQRESWTGELCKILGGEFETV
ncbi:hypothetical protein R70199_07477 [Paraburkholderia domus]|nr:hypothetical protein R70199_07477 [Paraburkholderia domus]